MKTKISLFMLILVLCFAMCGCGSSNEESQDSEPADTETSTEETASSGEGISTDELAEYYEFTIDGKDYALPCAMTDFTDNGFFISDDALNADLEENTFTFFDVYTDSSMEQKAFQVTAINYSDETKKIKDCPACIFEVGRDDSCAKSVTLKKSGVSIDVSSDEASTETGENLKKAYGTDEDVFSDNTDEDTIRYQWRLHYLVDSDQNDLIDSVREWTSIQEGNLSIAFSGKQ